MTKINDNTDVLITEYCCDVCFNSDPRDDFHRIEMNRYLAKPYPGKILLFRAKDNGLFEKSFTQPKFWKPYAKDGVMTYEITGDHLGILKKPNVQALAKYIKQYI